MKSHRKNVAYIDGANLHNGIKSLPWEVDYAHFRVWLQEKYSAKQAYLFLGMMPKYKELYRSLQEQGYTLVFKEVTYDNDGKAKGNCDADIVVLAMQDAHEDRFDGAVLVSSDGDYTPLVKFLISKQKMVAIVSPYETRRCSVLLKRTDVKISYIADQKTILEAKKKKPPMRTEPHKGLLRRDN